MKPRLVLIKIGGNLITDKGKPLTARLERIEFFANELAQVYAKFTDTDFIIGNGVGSFAHFPAHEYGLREGAKTPKQLYGTCVAHSEAQQINFLVGNTLLAKNLPVFTISPSAIFACSDGKVTHTNLDPAKGLLSRGLIPLVHGDMAYDHTRGATILSTEKVLHEFAKALHNNYKRVSVIYLMAVNGVLDQSGATIPVVAAKDKVVLQDSLEHDTTGGILGKVASARKTAKYATEVFLADGREPGVIEQILTGHHVGTKIVV